jgi:two-component system, OmpR family, sensor kinase
VIAFAYILVTVIVALEVPLAINMQRRVQSEVKSSAEASALIAAANIGAARAARPTLLQRYVTRHFPDEQNGRVIVIDPNGVLIADSTGSQNLGETYATPRRPELMRVLQTPEPTSEIRHSDTLGQDILVAAAPIIDEGTSYGAVRISQFMGEVQDRVRRVIAGLAIIGLAALFTGLIVAFALAGSFSRPLTKLAAVAKRLGGGDLSARAETDQGASEIVLLARSFDEMADRLEAMVKAQREFVANASHQLRTPLTGMKLRIEAAMAGASSEEVRRQLQAADTEVDRLSQIVDRLLVMARRIEEGGPSEIDLDEAVHRALDRWEDRASRKGATLTVRGEGGLALGERTDLDQILDNLIDNAVAYAPGPVLIEAGRADGRAFLAVEDVGPGIAADERHRVTDRFFRGRTALKGGTGLGLAIVRELAEKWGGAVVVETADGGGTRVEVRLNAAT